MHAVHTAQPQLLHEEESVFCALDAEQLAGRVGLSSGEHAAHGVGNMEVKWSRGRRREQLDEQLLERQVLMNC